MIKWNNIITANIKLTVIQIGLIKVITNVSLSVVDCPCSTPDITTSYKPTVSPIPASKKAQTIEGMRYMARVNDCDLV